MRALPTLLLATAGAIVSAVASQAATIAAGSTISFADGATYDSTTISFLSNNQANIPATTATGSFAAAFGAGCTGCATFYNFTYAPFSSPTLVYSATVGSLTTSFNLLALTTDSNANGFLNLGGTGTLTLTGFTPTPGTFLLSSQGPQGVNVSFSATAQASPIPEPASLALLGLGVMGLGILRRVN